MITILLLTGKVKTEKVSLCADYATCHADIFTVCADMVDVHADMKKFCSEMLPACADTVFCCESIKKSEAETFLKKTGVQKFKTGMRKCCAGIQFTSLQTKITCQL